MSYLDTRQHFSKHYAKGKGGRIKNKFHILDLLETNAMSETILDLYTSLIKCMFNNSDLKDNHHCNLFRIA